MGGISCQAQGEGKDSAVPSVGGGVGCGRAEEEGRVMDHELRIAALQEELQRANDRIQVLEEALEEARTPRFSAHKRRSG
jgi:hypothetical protein